MAENTEDVPLIVVEPQKFSIKMCNSFPSKIKFTALMFLFLAASACLYLYAKISYLRNKKLEHISAMASQAETMLESLYLMEHKMSFDLEELYEMIQGDFANFNDIFY